MSDVKLVKMKKDGAYLDVHPDTVEAHKTAGWTPMSSDQIAEESDEIKAYEAEQAKLAKAQEKADAEAAKAEKETKK